MVVLGGAWRGLEFTWQMSVEERIFFTRENAFRLESHVFSIDDFAHSRQKCLDRKDLCHVVYVAFSSHVLLSVSSSHYLII